MRLPRSPGNQIIRRFFAAALLLVALPALAPAQDLRLPNKPGSLEIAVIGDSGQPGPAQDAIASQMHRWRTRFPFEFVLMTGDNLYGREGPRDYEEKFSMPYKRLIDAGVKFHASLGNHDEDGQTLFKLFNMNGKKYYTFKPKNGVRFFALDSNYVDDKQLEWLDRELAASGSDWKIAFFHHPLYLIRCDTRVSRCATGSARTDIPEARCQRRDRGARALLRAAQAAEGRGVFHTRVVIEAAQG